MLPQNSLINGDALDVLCRIEEGKVDLIYLDPPWPYMADRKGPDLEGYYDFLSNVLSQCKRVLSESGNIFVFSNPELNADFTLLLKEVFGAKNYVTEFIIPKRTNSANFRSTHDTILFYRKSDKQFLNNRVIKASDEEIGKLFPYEDEKGRYRTQSLFIHTSGGRPNLEFDWKE